jgi:hypothetical protein
MRTPLKLDIKTTNPLNITINCIFPAIGILRARKSPSKKLAMATVCDLP